MTMHIRPARRIGWGIAGLAASLAAVTTSTPTPTGCGKLQQLLTTGSGTGSAAIGLG
ncbi:hypothetical protein ACFYUD_35515 [Nocardia tengchongensis]|uniref:hypothetical protein n=1 Tax=Nocardia tengchongensis TaxID=2055889 RepID=UPI0036751E7E